MGDTAKVDWDPGHSTFGQTLTGGSGSAFKNPNVYDPNQSTLGAFGRGEYGNAFNQTVGGLKNTVKAGADIGLGALNPQKTYSDLYNSVGGEPQAAERRQRDITNQNADNDALVQQEQMQQQAGQQQAAAQKAQQDKLNSYNLQQQGVADEDAFTQARNAARKAKGTSLFSAWG